MQDFLVTEHGESKCCYGGINELLGWEGQGNAFSRSSCKDVSCFMFNEKDKKRFGIIITSKSNHNEAQRVVISFVDYIAFCASRVKSQQKIKEIMNYFSTMCEATEGKVQKEIFMTNSWK